MCIAACGTWRPRPAGSNLKGPGGLTVEIRTATETNADSRADSITREANPYMDPIAFVQQHGGRVRRRSRAKT